MNWPKDPYKRLESYDAQDAPLFAGREQDVANVVQRVQRPDVRLFVLHGSSGCGKSSLLKAGVIPALNRANQFRFLDDAAAGRTLFVRSTADPLRKIVAELQRFSKQPLRIETPTGPEPVEFDTIFQRDPEATVESVCADPVLAVELCGDLAKDCPETLVLIVDQGEEVLTLSPGDEGKPARDLFFEFVARLTCSRHDFQLLLAARTEYFGRIVAQLSKRHANMDAIREYFLDELTPAQMKEAILRPTMGPAKQQYGFTIDGHVVKALVDDLCNTTLSGGKAPVLQLACASLVEQASVIHGEKQIRMRDYRELGGLEGQLDYYVDQCLIRFATAGKANSHLAINEAFRWKSVLAELARQQQDGTVTTELVGVSRLADLAAARGCERPLRDALPYFEQAHLVRDAGELRSADGSEVHYSLGHDALGIVLLRHRRRVAERAAQQRRGQKQGLYAGLAITLALAAGALFLYRVVQSTGGALGLLAYAAVFGVLTWMARRDRASGEIDIPNPNRIASSLRLIRMFASLANVPLVATYARFVSRSIRDQKSKDPEVDNLLRIVYPEYHAELSRFRDRFEKDHELE